MKIRVNNLDQAQSVLFPFCVSKSEKAKRQRKRKEKKRKEEEKVDIDPLLPPSSHMLEWAQHLPHCERQALTKLFKQNISKLITNSQLQIKIDTSIYAHFKSLPSSFLPHTTQQNLCPPLPNTHTPLIIFFFHLLYILHNNFIFCKNYFQN